HGGVGISECRIAAERAPSKWLLPAGAWLVALFGTFIAGRVQYVCGAGVGTGISAGVCGSDLVVAYCQSDRFVCAGDNSVFCSNAGWGLAPSPLKAGSPIIAQGVTDMRTPLVTRQGYENLRQELDQLWRRERPEVTQKV